MDVRIINPFLSASMNAFQSMFSIDVKAGKPFTLDPKSNHRWEISGILGITGDYNGILAFRLHQVLASKMLDKSGVVLGDEDDRADMIHGLVGEFTNIIAGNAASAITFSDIDISPPIVVLGENHRLAWPSNHPVIGIPFASYHGAFEVDVCIQEKAYIKTGRII